MFRQMETSRSTASEMPLAEMVRELSRVSAELKAIEKGAALEKIVPGEVAYRDPLDVYQQVTIGAVLTAYEFSAHDARALDGFLSMRPKDVLDDDVILDHWKAGVIAGKTMGEALMIFLNRAAAMLEDRGRYAEWRRRYDAYVDRTQAFLKTLDEGTLAAMLRKPPSRKQLWLVRYTVECLDVEFPELPDRRAAFLWLHDVAANPRYRRVK